jgi:SLOG family YspA-like protein
VEPGRTPPGARADASRSFFTWVVIGMRILVTGSKFWSDRRTIMEALSLVWEPDTVLVTGACPEGAEDLAASCWQHWGGHVERWPFNWDRPEGQVVIGRHRAMLRAGADVCLNFGSSTACGSLCSLAREAGVPVYGWPARKL